MTDDENFSNPLQLKEEGAAYVERNIPLIMQYLTQHYSLQAIYEGLCESDDPPPFKPPAFRYHVRKLKLKDQLNKHQKEYSTRIEENQPDKTKADAAEPDREKEKENNPESNPDRKPKLGEKGWKPKEAKKKLFKTFNHNPVANPDELI